MKENDRKVDMIRRGNVFGLKEKTYETIKEAKMALKPIGKRAPAKSVLDRKHAIGIVTPIDRVETMDSFTAVGEFGPPVEPDSEWLDEVIGNPVKIGGQSPDYMRGVAPRSEEGVAEAVPEAEDEAFPNAGGSYPSIRPTAGSGTRSARNKQPSLGAQGAHLWHQAITVESFGQSGGQGLRGEEGARDLGGSARCASRRNSCRRS